MFASYSFSLSLSILLHSLEPKRFSGFFSMKFLSFLKRYFRFSFLYSRPIHRKNISVQFWSFSDAFAKKKRNGIHQKTSRKNSDDEMWHLIQFKFCDIFDELWLLLIKLNITWFDVTFRRWERERSIIELLSIVTWKAPVIEWKENFFFLPLSVLN